MKPYITILFTALLITSCGKEDTKSEVETKPINSNILNLTEAQLRNLNLSTVSLKSESLPTTIKLNATVEITPHNTVSITHPFGGYVKRIALIPGNQVAKGQAVVTLEDPQYIQMQEDYLTTKALLEQASLDFDRQKDLNTVQAASNKIMEQAKASKQTLLVKKRSLEEKLKLMNISPSSVSVNNIKRTVNVFARIGGVVSEVFANTGKYVSPSDPILEIINTNDAMLKVKVFERDLPNLQIGQTIKAYTNANPNQKLEAHISSISSEINPDGTTDVFAKINNTNGIKITSNMYFNIELTTNNLKANALPEEAVVQFEGQNYIFEQNSKLQYKLIPVKLGVTANRFVEITSPLKPSKTYVSKGAYQLLTALKNSGEE